MVEGYYATSASVYARSNNSKIKLNMDEVCKTEEDNASLCETDVFERVGHDEKEDETAADEELPPLEEAELFATSELVPIFEIPATLSVTSPINEDAVDNQDAESAVAVNDEDNVHSNGADEVRATESSHAGEELSAPPEAAVATYVSRGQVSLQQLLQGATPKRADGPPQEVSPPPPIEAPPISGTVLNTRAEDDSSCLGSEAIGYSLSVEIEAWREQNARQSRELESVRARSEVQRAEIRELHEMMGSLKAELELCRRREAVALDAAAESDERCARAEDNVAKLTAEVNVWRRDHTQMASALARAQKELAEFRRARRGDEPKGRLSTSLADWSAAHSLAPPAGRDHPANEADFSGQRQRRPKNELRNIASKQQRSSHQQFVGGAAPFATEDDLKQIHRRQPLERDLVKLNIERDALLAEVSRLPEPPRSHIQRDRRHQIDFRLQQLQHEANLLKSRIKEIV